MAIPVPVLIQAVTTLIPLFTKKRKSETEKAQAKQALVDNNGPLSSAAGLLLFGGGVAYASTEEAIMGGLTALVGVALYFYRKHTDDKNPQEFTD